MTLETLYYKWSGVTLTRFFMYPSKIKKKTFEIQQKLLCVELNFK